MIGHDVIDCPPRPIRRRRALQDKEVQLVRSVSALNVQAPQFGTKHTIKPRRIKPDTDVVEHHGAMNDAAERRQVVSNPGEHRFAKPCSPGIQRDLPPIHSIVHGAMVLDDVPVDGA